ncbi:Lsr2 family protein [Kribbella sp. NPDC056861]|uniref:histone-like nucleoid-structuring protein Lsr2 n=1 Tax=Kribbella sp. NPDC056861 TaxID=3154857 RepID=UPI0034472EB5
MGERTEVVKYDDLDGTDIPAGKVETIAFEFDGKAYEIDLNKKNAAGFRRAVTPYLEAARPRRVSRPKGHARPKASRPQHEPEDTKAIKAWAREQGYEVQDRGRIPNEVRRAYEQLQQQ